MEIKFKRTIKNTDKPKLAQKTRTEQSPSKMQTQACLKMPTLLGVESALKQELLDLGFTLGQIKANDGLVMLTVPINELAQTIALLNLSLRTAERVLLNLTSFSCTDFTTLFNNIESLAVEQYLDAGFFLEVVGYSRDSQLSSVPALQRLIKKATIKRLSLHSPQKANLYVDGIWQEDKNLGTNRLQFSLVKNEFSLDLDTTGEALYKRGYRPLNHPAPIRETLAASILYYAHFLQNCQNYAELLFDPVCGSGTFTIEAALLLTKTAPGLQRKFAAEEMQIVGETVFASIKTKLKEQSLLFNPLLARQLETVKGHLFGADIELAAIKQAEKNAKQAGVAELIKFKVADLTNYAKSEHLPFAELNQAERVLIVANPPYGERLGTENEVKAIHQALKKLCFEQKLVAQKLKQTKKVISKLKNKLRFSVITSQNTLEKEIGCPADKRRKLYNGMLACTLYQYFRHE